MFIRFTILVSIVFFSCGKEPEVTSQDILDQLKNNYTLLPEEMVSISADSTVYAQYTDPTMDYTHGILGDIIEGTKLVVHKDAKFYELTLESDFVFEDLRPRLVDVDMNGELEFICIRSHTETGAGLVIYKIENEALEEYAYIAEIGKPNRWLNFVAADDLDNDGEVELAWIETPHIGGILKVARVQRGELTIIDEASLYTNHAIGERNLCLSVLTEINNTKRFYVSNQELDKVVGFSFTNNSLKIEEEIDLKIDFSVPLKDQYDFGSEIIGEDNCIW